MNIFFPEIKKLVLRNLFWLECVQKKWYLGVGFLSMNIEHARCFGEGGHIEEAYCVTRKPQPSRLRDSVLRVAGEAHRFPGVAGVPRSGSDQPVGVHRTALLSVVRYSRRKSLHPIITVVGV